jgi:hypothetical protein
VDTSAYKKDRQIHAVVTPFSALECKGAAETSEYKLQLAADLPEILYQTE